MTELRVIAYFTASCILGSCHAATAAEPPRPQQAASIVTPAATSEATAEALAPLAAASEAAPQFAAATAQGEGFRVSMSAITQYHVGSADSVLVAVDAVPPYKCNDQYPVRFKLDVHGAATFPQAVVKAAQTSHDRISLQVPFTPTTPGPLRISGELAFSVCTEEKCVVQKAPLSVVVQVSASN